MYKKNLKISLLVGEKLSGKLSEKNSPAGVFFFYKVFSVD